MTSQKTPVAVVGLGNMGRYHIKHYLNLPSSHVVAVVDQDPSRLSQFAVDGVRGFRSVSELLASGLAEAVSITVPTSLHFKVAQECLLAGLHVLIEKPITESVSDAEELIRLAESMNKIIQVGHIERFNPAVLKLLEWQKEGKTGRIYSIETRRFSPMPTQILDANVIIDLAVHDIDIVCALFNSQPTDISREMAMNTLSDRADSGIILLRFPDGIASVSVNWTSPVKTRTLTAFCENGKIELDYLNQTLQFTSFSTHSEIEIAAITPGYPLDAELAAFIKSIQTQTSPIVSGEDGLRALRIANQILAAPSQSK